MLFSTQMQDYTHAVLEADHTKFLGVMVYNYTYSADVNIHPIGHYQQDANTYAEWGVDCMSTTFVIAQHNYIIVPLQMLKWTGVTQSSIIPSWILISNILKW